MKTKLEYIWLDGYKPTQSLRSKTLVETDFGGTLDDCPMWAFDGSSTEQATGDDSDCLLKPVAIFPDPCRKIPVAGRRSLAQSDHVYGFICQRPEKACANRSIPFLAT